MPLTGAGRVHVAFAEHACYGQPPFDPPVAYPELVALGAMRTDRSNTAYDVVRRSLRAFDAERFGSANWDPLGALVRPGDTVVLKPNLVTHDWQLGLELRTHPAVIRALADYVCLALRGSGRIVICDCPLQGADFGRLTSASGLDRVLDALRAFSRVAVELTDLRGEWARIDDGSGFILERRPLPGDKAGNSRFDLADRSALAVPSWDPASLSVGDYGTGMMTRSHAVGRHEYQFGNTLLTADVVLSIAKMKTHQKAGVTGALKNTVGMTTAKDGLPHYRTGAPPEGDEYPSALANRVVAHTKRRFQGRVPLPLWSIARWTALHALDAMGRITPGGGQLGLIGGGWEGNDTVWRMVLDINRIFQCGLVGGTLAHESVRRAHYFVDGIVAGEGEGPLRSTPRRVGVVIHGADPVAVDITMALLMGYDPARIPLLQCAVRGEPRVTRLKRLEDVEVWCDGALLDRIQREGPSWLTPPRGWPGLTGSLAGPQLESWLSERFLRWQ